MGCNRGGKVASPYAGRRRPNTIGIGIGESRAGAVVSGERSQARRIRELNLAMTRDCIAQPITLTVFVEMLGSEP